MATSLDPCHDPSSAPAWLAGIRVQMRVIGALMIRDALSRYGHGSLGFFWVVGEPLLLTTGHHGAVERSPT